MSVPWWGWCLLTLFLVLFVHAMTCVMCLSKDVRRRVLLAESALAAEKTAEGAPATGANAKPSNAVAKRADASFFSTYFQLDEGADDAESAPTFHTRIASDSGLATFTLHSKVA